MEGARFLALLLYFEGRVAIAPLKRDALHISPLGLGDVSLCYLLYVYMLSHFTQIKIII